MSPRADNPANRRFVQGFRCVASCHKGRTPDQADDPRRAGRHRCCFVKLREQWRPGLCRPAGFVTSSDGWGPSYRPRLRQTHRTKVIAFLPLHAIYVVGLYFIRFCQFVKPAGYTDELLEEGATHLLKGQSGACSHVPVGMRRLPAAKGASHLSTSSGYYLTPSGP